MTGYRNLPTPKAVFKGLLTGANPPRNVGNFFRLTNQEKQLLLY